MLILISKCYILYFALCFWVSFFEVFTSADSVGDLVAEKIVVSFQLSTSSNSLFT